MKATQQLKNEHESIKLILNIMEKITSDTQKGKELNTDHFAKIIEFTNEYSDKCHHSKEEEILIPAMVDQGMPNGNNQTAIFLNLSIEHQLGRSHIKLLSNALYTLKKGNKLAINHILLSSMNYVQLLRNHIEKENNILFTMADKVLNEKAQSTIFDAFKKLEVEKIGVNKQKEYHQSLNELTNIYL